MKQLILHTNNDWTGLIIRLTTGLILFPTAHKKYWDGLAGQASLEKWLILPARHICPG
ncbi:hypothetical protein [Taibaiella koreensis]|uniref:hypothetical protein n=1 Tax=Taibaiella koreensis TaxID=1268548 RepID=UPI0019695BF1|nr:hypothetical protein [Taibaiella koreensis]